MQRKTYEQTIAIDISGPLKIKAKDISKYLVISIGEQINEESVLAKKKSFLGVDKIEIRSPVEGTVSNIDTEKGVILVSVQEIGMEEEDSKDELGHKETGHSSNEITNYELRKENGEEEEKKKQEIDEEVEIEVNKRAEKIQKTKKINSSVKTRGLDGFGDGKGIGLYIEKFNSRKISSEMRDLIIICDNLPEIKVFYKASAVGIEGIICNTRNEGKIEKLKKEMENKTHVGFLVLSNEIDLKSLHGRMLEIDNGVLEVE